MFLAVASSLRVIRRSGLQAYMFVIVLLQRTAVRQL